MVLSACTSDSPESKVSSAWAVCSCAAHSVAPSEHCAPARFPGLTATRVLAFALQKSVSPATEATIGTCPLRLYAALHVSAIRPAHHVCVAPLFEPFVHSNRWSGWLYRYC